MLARVAGRSEDKTSSAVSFLAYFQFRLFCVLVVFARFSVGYESSELPGTAFLTVVFSLAYCHFIPSRGCDQRREKRNPSSVEKNKNGKFFWKEIFYA